MVAVKEMMRIQAGFLEINSYVQNHENLLELFRRSLSAGDLVWMSEKGEINIIELKYLTRLIKIRSEKSLVKMLKNLDVYNLLF